MILSSFFDNKYWICYDYNTLRFVMKWGIKMDAVYQNGQYIVVTIPSYDADFTFLNNSDKVIIRASKKDSKRVLPNDGIIYVLVKKMIHKVNKVLFNNKPYQKYFHFLRR